MEQTELTKKLIKKYNLREQQKILLKELKLISNEENIELKELIMLLNCYKGIIYKTDNCWTRINMQKKCSIKKYIKMIKIDLKYLKQYGERMYTQREIKQICNTYAIKFEQFITYMNRNKISYYESMYIIQKNKEGIWIGEKPEISKGFLKENLEKIEESLEKLSNTILKRYQCYWLKERIKNGAFEEIIKHGEMEKNYKFDCNRCIEKLLYRAKCEMLNIIIQEFKNMNFNNKMLNITREENPEGSVDEWLFPIELNVISCLILEEIRGNINNVLINRAKAFKRIYIKLNITKQVFYENLKNIQKTLIKCGKVKVCKNGKVIINEI